MNRCAWLNLNNPLYVHYHDHEWGVPVHDDQKLFEMLMLECFQAGLSWECILNKQAHFRAAFDNFDIDKISRYDDKKCQELLANPNIIRNRLKIKACVQNSRIFQHIQAEFGSFDAYIWGFTNGQTCVEEYCVRTTSPLSDEIAKDLKKRGMAFLGSTTIYAYLQSIGIINGHGKECDWHSKSITI